ncbi:MAG: hypothetical protein ACRC8Z_11805 [Empedobacter falsenii]
MNFSFYYFIYNPAEKFEIEYKGKNNKNTTFFYWRGVEVKIIKLEIGFVRVLFDNVSEKVGEQSRGEVK